MRLCAPPCWGLWACAAAGVLLQAARACIVIDLNPSGGSPVDAGLPGASPFAADDRDACHIRAMSLPSATQLPMANQAPAKAKQRLLVLVSLVSACLAGFHANVNNLLALIPLVAHLHNDTVHYRMEYFHYKVRLEASTCRPFSC